MLTIFAFVDINECCVLLDCTIVIRMPLAPTHLVDSSVHVMLLLLEEMEPIAVRDTVLHVIT